MKSLLGVLLLCFVCMAKGDDPCTLGEKAVAAFMDVRNCERDRRGEEADFMGPFIHNASADNLRSGISGYCSVMMPAVRDCFRQKIQNCSADRRAVLTRVMEETGFVCQPNTSNVHPNIAHLLAHFSDADFEDDNCVPETSPYAMHMKCGNEMLAAMGFASFREFRQFLDSATVEELMPYVPVLLNTFMECVATTIRDLPNRCRNWRGQVIFMLRWNLIPTTLGRTMTFTTEQLDEMFEFQDTEESGAGQSAQSFLSKTFFGRP